MPVRGSLSPCPFCDGQGLLTFERGPEVEPCTECKGTGRVYGDPMFRGLFAELLRQKGVFLDADMRLLLLGLDALDQRLEALEVDASRSS
jgi:hypothetical protein